MSWITDLFKGTKKTKRLGVYAPTFNGTSPLYPMFGTNIYASDVVQQALSCIVDEIKKLEPMHIRQRGTDITPVKSSLQDVLNEPNERMTTSEFIEKFTTLLLLNQNAFIIPVYYVWEDAKTGQKVKNYTALYPINPQQVDIMQDETNAIFYKFTFRNGFEMTCPEEDVIHLKLNYALNDFMGGNEFGQPNNEAILQTLELNKTLLDGIAKSLKASYQVNGVIKLNTMLDSDKMDIALREFEEKVKSNESGFLPMDLKGEFIPIEHNPKIVDEATLKFVDEKILRNWGVPLNILTGNYTSEEHEAFYQKTIESKVIGISQAFTKKLISKREKSYGNKVVFYPKDLIFMNVTQTLKMIEELSPTGALYENEKRAALGLRPLPELEGKRYMSLNWIDANNANAYQIGTADDTEKEKEGVTENEE